MASTIGATAQPAAVMPENGLHLPDHDVNGFAVYHRLLFDIIPVYRGERRTVTFPDWQKHIGLLFRAHKVPEVYKLRLAELNLQGSAMRLWCARQHELGENPTFSGFCGLMSQHFALVTDMSHWESFADQINQFPGETIIAFGWRFEQAVINNYPIPPMSELHKMKLYYRNIRAEYRLPRPVASYASWAEMRAAHEVVDDMDTIPYVSGPAPAPPAPAPVPSVPSPAASAAASAVAPPPASAVPVPVPPAPVPVGGLQVPTMLLEITSSDDDSDEDPEEYLADLNLP